MVLLSFAVCSERCSLCVVALFVLRCAFCALCFSLCDLCFTFCALGLRVALCVMELVFRRLRFVLYIVSCELWMFDPARRVLRLALLQCCVLAFCVNMRSAFHVVRCALCVLHFTFRMISGSQF